MTLFARLDRVPRIFEDAARAALGIAALLLLLTLGGTPMMSRAMAVVGLVLTGGLTVRCLVRWRDAKGDVGTISGAGVLANAAGFALLELAGLFAWMGWKPGIAIFALPVVLVAPFLGLGLSMHPNEKRLRPTTDASVAETRLLARALVILALAALAIGWDVAIYLGIAGVVAAVAALSVGFLWLHHLHRSTNVRRGRDGVAPQPFVIREAETFLAATFLLAAIALRIYLGPTTFVLFAAAFAFVLAGLDVIQVLMHFYQERAEAEPPYEAPAKPPTASAPAPTETKPAPAPAPPTTTKAEAPPPAPAPAVVETPPAPEPEPPPPPKPEPPPLPPPKPATLHFSDGTEPEMSEPHRVLADLLGQTLHREASELQFHRMEDRVHVLFVQDGVPLETEPMTAAEYEPVRAAILDLAKEDRRFGAEGANGFAAIQVVLDRGSTNLKIVRPPPELPSLEGLGMMPEIAGAWRELIHGSGFLLICGPPESGKTTTLYASLMEIDRTKKKVVSLERRVERTLPGVEHIEVGVTESMADRIRALMDKNCDVLAVGELDEPEAVREAVIFSMRRGRIVIGATWAALFALSGLAKIAELGVDKLKIGMTVRGVLAQRLARRACERCRVEGDVEAAVLHDLKLKEPPKPCFVAPGCDGCGHAGYKGRIGLFELIALRPFVAGRLLEERDFQMVEAMLRDANFRPIKDEGIDKALAGHTTIEEVARVMRER